MTKCCGREFISSPHAADDLKQFTTSQEVRAFEKLISGMSIRDRSDSSSELPLD